MRAYRKYYNATDDLLREDTIDVVLRYNYKDVNMFNYMNKDLKMRYRVNTSTRKVYGPTGLGSRDVDRIELVGDFSSCETSSGDYSWASWDIGNGQNALADMSGLPVVGDAV